MDRLPCYIIEDLLPLYLEGEVHPNTKQVIEQHVIQCTSCAAMVEGAKPIVVEQETVVLEEAVPGADGLKKALGRLRRFVIVALTLFIGITIIGGLGSYNFGLRAERYRLVKRVRSEARYQEYFYGKIPRLKTAEQLGMIQGLGIDLPVTEEGITLRLERIWYNPDNIYLFYSLPGNQRHNHVGGSLLLQKDDGPLTHSPGYGGVFVPGEGVVYEGRFYSIITFAPFQEQVEGQWIPKQEIQDLRFKGTVSIGDRNYSLDPVDLPVNINLLQSFMRDDQLDLDNVALACNQ